MAVVDGSTSKSAMQMEDGVSNGRLAMQLICQIIGRLPAETDLEGFCTLVTKEIHTYYDSHGISIERLRNHPEERLTASVAVFSLHHCEIWLVGDCQCITGGTYHDNPKPEEASIASHRARLVEAMLADGRETVSSLRRHDTARDIIVPDIVKTCHRQNIDFAVVDGFEIARNKIIVIKADPFSDIVLATDGYPFLYGTLSASEEALAAQLSDDPLCIHSYQATKGQMAGNLSFDDRAYLRFRINR